MHYELRSAIHDYDLRFEWISINEAFPAESVSIENLKLPRKTKIVSMQTGKPVYEGMVGEKPRVQDLGVPNSSNRRLHVIVIAALGVVVLGCLIRWGYRRR